MEIHDHNKVPELISMLEELQSYHIEIGILGDGKGGESHDDGDISILGIAIVHEFGHPSIGIPERSFIRAGFDSRLDDMEREAKKLLDQVLDLKLDVLTFMNTLGHIIVGMLQEYLTDMDSPSLKQATIDAKGGRTGVLIDTGRLREAIEYRVVRA